MNVSKTLLLSLFNNSCFIFILIDTHGNLRFITFMFFLSSCFPNSKNTVKDFHHCKFLLCYSIVACYEGSFKMVF